MCTVRLPPGGNTIAVKYIISYHIIYHISCIYIYSCSVQRCCQQLHLRSYAVSCSDGLRKSMGNINEGSRPLEQDLNPWLSRAKIRTHAHSTALLSLKHVEKKIQKANKILKRAGLWDDQAVCVCSSNLTNELADRLGETKLVTNVITLEVTQTRFLIISYNQ
jgi:hypothetical protein